MSFKIPVFNVPKRQEDNANLFSFFSNIFGRWSGSELILERALSIGTWDVPTTSSVSINYKRTNATFSFKVIRSLQVVILNDAEDTFYDVSLCANALASVTWNTTNITLTKAAGGIFDNAGFNSTTITTRGYVIVRYVT